MARRAGAVRGCARHLEDVGRHEVAERRALDRDERIDGHRLRVLRQRGELVEQADTVRLRLAWVGLGLGLGLGFGLGFWVGLGLGLGMG